MRYCLKKKNTKEKNNERTVKDMARFSDEFLSELRMKNDIEQTISGYIPLKRRGKNLVGLCPFHNEKTPSFTVYPENQSFYCFGCGATGDGIKMAVAVALRRPS